MTDRIIRVPYVREPSVFVLEIGGEPIVAFEAISTAEAQELAKEEWLKTELLDLRSKGLPVWNGQAHIRIGPATGDDVANVSELLKSGRGQDDVKLIYLVELDSRPERDRNE